MTIAQAIYTAFARHYRRWANRTVLQSAIARLHEVEPQDTKARALAEHTLERMASVCEGLEVPDIWYPGHKDSLYMAFESQHMRLVACVTDRVVAWNEQWQTEAEFSPHYAETDEQLAALWKWYKE